MRSPVLARKTASTFGLAIALTITAHSGHARADDKAECVAAADEGQQLRDEGSYLRAHDAFVTCARLVCPAVVSKSCTQWLHDLDDGMPSIVVRARDERGNDLASVRVFLDGVLLSDKLDGRPISVDPGEHVLRFESADGKPVEQRVVVRASEKNRAIDVTLTGANAVPVAETTSEPPPAPAPTGVSRARIVTTLGLLGVGALAAGGGVYFGLASQSERNTANNYRAAHGTSACVGSSSQLCQNWSDAVDAQNREATLNRVFLVGSAVFASAALITWLAWPTANAPAASGVAWISPALAPGHAALNMGGSF